MIKKGVSKNKIFISVVKKIGMVHLQGVEKQLQKGAFSQCFLITSVQPHENVIKYADQIKLLTILVASDAKQEKERIQQENPEVNVVMMDSYHLAGRDGMLDGD